MSNEEQKEILYDYLIESGAMPEKYLETICAAFGYTLKALQAVHYAIFGEEFDFDDNDF